ncbi:Lrp/AsnC family transcriptional regulator [Amycolatopsis benzoatilytica]|uniref:Lrp/AsnC family transcriptional regulator n=1 Tax=Amycolatopsis benzoatilytica TaxID=346045 RepID=UPI00036F6E1F|nr:Lrp/AsnC family transcriptional regulator [Amycolatopsis benzoatilytica]
MGQVLVDEIDRRIAAVLMASPRASWRAVAEVLGLSERTVLRRASPLLHDGTLRPTAVRNPARFPRIVPMALRIRCRPSRIKAIAAGLARRPDTVWVDILGGGNEISTVLFLDGPEARNALLLRDLPATADVQSWEAHDLMRVFTAGFAWSAGLLHPDEFAALASFSHPPADAPPIQPLDEALIAELSLDARASYHELAARLGTSASTVRRRLDQLLAAHLIRLTCEVDLRLLGIASEALLWISASPGELGAIGDTVSRHPQVRFTAATTGSANLLVAVAAENLDGLYRFLTETVGSLAGIRDLEVTPILSSVKRAGRVRPED